MAPVLWQCVGGYSLVLAWVFIFSSCGRGQLCTCGIDFSLVLVYKILYSCDVMIISISSREAPLYV